MEIRIKKASICTFFTCISLISQAGIIGLTNVSAGLSAWREGSSQISNPGVDIVWLGDSIPGTGNQSKFQLSMFHIMKIQLQSLLNPSGVRGGFGLLTTGGGGPNLTYQSGNSDARGPVFVTSALGPTDDYGTWSTNPIGEGCGVRHFGMGPATNLALIYRWLGADADAAVRRGNVTSMQLVYRGYPNGGPVWVDGKSNAIPFRGTGTFTGYVPTSLPTTTFGARSQKIYTNNRLVNWIIALRSDGLSTVGRAYVDGAIFYDGDENAGIRVHDMTNSGCPFSLWNENSLKASIDSWGTGVAGQNAKLFIISNFLIEISSYDIPEDTVVQRMRDRIRRIMALSSHPSVLLIVPKMPSNWTGESIRPSRYSSVLAKMNAMVVEENAALLDFGMYADYYFPFTNYAAYLTSDFMHFNEAGHAMSGAALTRILVKLNN